MSYRLVNSNEIAIKYPEVNEMDCIYVDLPNGLDNEYHYIDAEPNTAIETVDWYHQNADGEMVLGANSWQQAWFKADDVFKAVNANPYVEFCKWVASEVCNVGFEEMWTLGAFAEVACRKLYALGIVQKFRDEWVYVDKDELDGGENDTK